MMAVQNRILVIFAVSLLWIIPTLVLADSDDDRKPLAPPVQNVDVGIVMSPVSADEGDEELLLLHHYGAGPAVGDDSTSVDVDGPHVVAPDVDDGWISDASCDDDLQQPDAFGDGEDDLDERLLAAPKLSFASTAPSSSETVYEFTAKDLDGNDVSLSKYEGQALLIVNYANFCGLTIPNVHKLSKWAKKYGPKGLTVLMFPSNTFCQNLFGPRSGKSLKKRHPEFEVFSAISVNGDEEHPLYTFLKSSTPGNGFLSQSIKWNFTKFLIDKNGHPVARYNPLTYFSTIEDGLRELLETPQNIE